MGTPSINWQKAGLLAVGGLIGAAALRELFGGSKQQPPRPSPDAHRVFISHSWKYKDQFDQVTRLLDEDRTFEWYDHSVSKDDPIDAQLPNHLRKKLRDQMQSTSVVLVLAGMYAAHSDWIQEEVEMAAEMGKTIIGIRPQGNERVPALIQKNAEEIVELEAGAILDAIHRHSS